MSDDIICRRCSGEQQIRRCGGRSVQLPAWVMNKIKKQHIGALTLVTKLSHFRRGNLWTSSDQHYYLPPTNISVWSDSRQRKTLVRWVGGYRSVGVGHPVKKKGASNKYCCLSCLPSGLVVSYFCWSITWTYHRTDRASKHRPCPFGTRPAPWAHARWFFVSFFSFFSFLFSSFCPFLPFFALLCITVLSSPLFRVYVCATAMLLVLSRSKWYGIVYDRSLWYRSLCVLVLRYYFVCFLPSIRLL